MLQTVPITLNAGVVVDDMPLGTQLGLVQAKNAVWDYPNPISNIKQLNFPTVFPAGTGITFATNSSLRDIGFTANSTNSEYQKLAFGFSSGISSQYTAWPIFIGNTGSIAFVGGFPAMTISGSGGAAGCNVYWRTPGAALGATIFFSHPDVNKVMYLRDDQAVIRSYTDTVTNAPTGATAMCVHLDRLWLSNSTSTNSTIWFSDPFDASTIVSTNFVSIPDNVLALVPTSVGGVDTSGVPHLLIFGARSIYVIDGDPLAGNAVLRDISVGLGIVGSHAVCRTPYGLFFVGSDHKMYTVDLTAQRIVPIAENQSNAIARRITNSGSVTPDTGGSCQLLWFAPYIYYYSGGGMRSLYLINPANPNMWWGPSHDSNTVYTRDVAIFRAADTAVSGLAPSGGDLTAIYTIGTLPDGVTGMYYPTRFDNQTSTSLGSQNVIQYLKTGLYNVPGHRVVPFRLTLQTRKKVNAFTWTVSAYTNADTTLHLGVQTPDTLPIALGTNSDGHESVIHSYVFPTLRAAKLSDGVGFIITTNTPALKLDLQRAWANFHLEEISL